jgi:hypothetical protein
MIINAGLYQIRLREEYNNMRRLQQDTVMKKILSIVYVDRVSCNEMTMQEVPEANLYPEQYKVCFKLPVFIAKDNLKKDWQGIFTVRLTQDTLMNPESGSVPAYQLDTAQGVPFNHHITQGYFCTGGLWTVAKDYGLWYFIIGCGSILNQESAWMDDSGAGHLNNDAYLYWKLNRMKRKITDIQWPFDLRSRIEVSDKQEILQSRIKICCPVKREIQKIKILSKFN